MKQELPIKQMRKKIKNCIWALQNEPHRVWGWMHRHHPLTGKRYSFFEACRAVCQNPPVFDMGWDMDMEKE